MTLKQCVRKLGIQSEVSKLVRIHTYDVDFLNSDGDNDETQFDARNINELNNLYSEFCKENGYARNTVLSITIVDSI